MKNPASVWRLSEWQVSPFDSKKFDTNEAEERLPEYAKASWPQTQVTASRWMTKFMAVSLTLFFWGLAMSTISRAVRGVAVVAAVVSGLLLSFGARAAPQLQCTFDVNSETHHRVFALASDPYAVEGVPIGNRFRFKAIVLGEGARVDSVNLYVYYNTRRQPMLMQHTQYLQPPVASGAFTPGALTGKVAVYSPLLGKELMYGCSLQEVAP